MTDGYYKCDRCGDFEKGPIKRSNSGIVATDFADPDYRKFKYGHRTGEDDTGSATKTVDLCEDCRKALTEWLEASDE